MTAFFKTTLFYVIAATALTLVIYEDPAQTLEDFARIASSYVQIIGGAAIKVLPVALPLIWWFGQRGSPGRLRVVFLVAVAAILLQIGFLLLKSAIPRFVPFYADPFWVWLDQWLLFGHDAWELAHALTPQVLAAWFPLAYISIWALLAYAFPILVAASDPDEARMQRYVWLFFLSWVVTGNLLALAGSSVGPVFYDQLMGTERFADMRASFDMIGFSSGQIALLQERLWDDSDGRLSFISAFPSVHVAVAAIAALYLRERFRRLRLVGDLFVALILLISIYSGYHYLVDGIASLGIVLGLNAVLLRYGGRQALPGSDAVAGRSETS